MADKVTFAVSCTPQEELTNENSGTTYVIASEVNKSLGGSGTATCASYAGTAADQGYLNATVNYMEAIDSADTTDISSEGTATFVFIKNTGYTFSSATALGDALDKSLKVMSGSTLISVLDAGEAIVLKDDNAGIACTGIHVRTVDTDGSNNTSAGHLAVEYLVVD
tara:strand:+ start:9049 stop:9546 length:498 start_codon:yes stop_codon:yes gene_type:complete